LEQKTLHGSDDPAVGGDWLQTWSGRELSLSDFGLSLGTANPAIEPRETARVLSGIERFGARCMKTYVVADHSLRVAWRVRELGGSVLDQFYGLNHEGDESLLGFDPPSPLLAICPDLRAVKRRAHLAYFARYALSPELPAVVKEADLDLLVAERRDLMRRPPRAWHPSLEARALAVLPEMSQIHPIHPSDARELWLGEWVRLGTALVRDYRAEIGPDAHASLASAVADSRHWDQP
jgi:hypothetical protein